MYPSETPSSKSSSESDTPPPPNTSINTNTNTNYQFYTRPKEIDYNPPEYIPPSDDEYSEDSNPQKDSENDTDSDQSNHETEIEIENEVEIEIEPMDTPNMYETRNYHKSNNNNVHRDQSSNHNNNNNYFINNTKRTYYTQYYQKNNTDRSDNMPCTPSLSENTNTDSEFHNTNPKIFNTYNKHKQRIDYASYPSPSNDKYKNNKYSNNSRRYVSKNVRKSPPRNNNNSHRSHSNNAQNNQSYHNNMNSPTPTHWNCSLCNNVNERDVMLCNHCSMVPQKKTHTNAPNNTGLTSTVYKSEKRQKRTRSDPPQSPPNNTQTQTHNTNTNTEVLPTQYRNDIPMHNVSLYKQFQYIAANIVLQGAQHLQEQHRRAQTQSQSTQVTQPKQRPLPPPKPVQTSHNQSNKNCNVQTQSPSELTQNNATKHTWYEQIKNDANSSADHEIDINARAAEMDPKINDDTGTTDRDFKIHKIMLRFQNKIEKRQTKMDKKTTDVQQTLERLERQKEEMRQRIEFDEQRVLNEFRNIKKAMMEQYNTQKSYLNETQAFLKRKSKEFKRLNEKTSTALFAKNESGKKPLIKDLETQLRSFDAQMREIRICKPKLKYDSLLAERYKRFEDTIDNHKPLEMLFDSHDEEEKSCTVTTDGNEINKWTKYENKIVFVDGVLSGIVPIMPDTLDISLAKSYKKKEESVDNNECKNVSDLDRESVVSENSESAMSMATITTVARLNLSEFKKLRVMWDYSEISDFHLQNLNISEMNVVLEMKNFQSRSVRIPDMSVNFFEFDVNEDLKVYEGCVKVRARNKNGWSQFKCVVFKFNEYGNKLKM